MLLSRLVGAPLPPQELRFRDFFRSDARELKPSERLRALDGHRVRIAGFVAHDEEPVEGGFFLCPFPVAATEPGAVAADVPPQTVFVVRPERSRAVEHRDAPLQVTGTLELGAGGEPWPIRVVLDPA